MAGARLVGASAARGEARAGRVKSGTGLFVSRDGFLVTSEHVVAGCQNVSVWGPDGVERPSYLVASDRRLDIALLWADSNAPWHSAVAARQTPHVGEQVFTLGFGVVAMEPLRALVIEGFLVGDSKARSGNRIRVI